MTYENKVASIRRRIRDLESAVVAFSGGVDSALLTVLTHEELKDKMCAATSISPSIPSRDRLVAITFCRERKISHILIETNEFADPNYKSNPKDRCFYCKQALYKGLSELALQKGFRFVIEGTNASDLSGHRPGYKASLEAKNVATPLIDAGMTKDDVRRLARELGLSVSDKPSSACLSSRIPEGTSLSPDLLKRIDNAEEIIRACGISQVRVRHHDELARIEISRNDFTVFFKHSDDIHASLRKLGYKFVTLDVIGYRTGGSSA